MVLQPKLAWVKSLWGTDQSKVCAKHKEIFMIKEPEDKQIY